MKISKKHASLLMATSAIGAMLLAMIAPSAAFADASIDTIDPNATGSINITKYAITGNAGAPGDGTQASDPGGTPLPGVTYKLCQIPADLTTDAGWETVTELTNDIITPYPEDAGYTCLPENVKTTDSNGQIVYSDLPVGLYWLMETGVPQGVAASAAPFLVTIPMVDPADTENWMYDVYVYPKNIVNAATKSIVDEDAVVLGDTITYSISLPLTDTSAGSYDSVQFYDKLDSRLALDPPDEGDGSPSAITVTTNHPGDPACAISSDDWTSWVMPPVDEMGGWMTELADNQYVILMKSFHDCAVAYDDAALTVTITAKVVGPIGNGIIENSAMVYPNQYSFNADVPIITNTVTTKWGNIDINKTGKDGAPLAGVTFQLYYAYGDGAMVGPVTDASGTAITLTTDATGAAQVAVRYSCYVNDATVTGDACRTYYLVETSTLPGYILLDKPIKVDSVNSLTTTVDVVNVLSSPLLPLTGGSMPAGTWALYGGGCLILVGGALLMTRLRRQAIAKAA